MPDRGDGRRVSKVTMRDPYSVLGVKKDARDDEIKAAWRARAKSVHPDHNASDPLAASRFAEIGAAYDLLKDPEKRRRYDARRRKAHYEEVIRREMALQDVDCGCPGGK